MLIKLLLKGALLLNRLPVNQLTPDMIMAESIFDSDTGQILVAEGTRLNEAIISRLSKKNLHQVFVYDPATIEADPGEIMCNKILERAITTLNNYLPKHLYKDRDGKVKAKHAKLVEILGKVIRDPKVSSFFVDLSSVDDLTMEHSINVCVFSLLTGHSLNLSDGVLVALGQGGLLHDVGRLLIDKSLLKRETFSPEEEKAYKEHINHGYKMLREAGFDTNVAKVALYHHEKWDGSGYMSLAGEKVDLLSRIVGVADVYDGFTGNYGGTNRFMPHEGMEYLYGAGNLYYDARIVKAFIHSVPIYPLGSLVQLSTGEIGIVVNVEKNIPVRPIVKVCYDKNKQRLKYYSQLDLYTEKTIFITKVLS